MEIQVRWSKTKQLQQYEPVTAEVEIKAQYGSDISPADIQRIGNEMFANAVTMVEQQLAGPVAVQPTPAPAPAPATVAPVGAPAPAPVPVAPTPIAAPVAGVAPAPAPAAQDDGKLAYWQHLVANPGDWYDNRANKNSPKSPDFKSKSIADPKNPAYKIGLWLPAPAGIVLPAGAPVESPF